MFVDHTTPVAPDYLARLHDRLHHRRLPAEVRTPATIDPEDRRKWAGFAAAYAHLGRSAASFVRDAVGHYRSGAGRHAERTLTGDNLDAEVAALVAGLGEALPEEWR